MPLMVPPVPTPATKWVIRPSVCALPIPQLTDVVSDYQDKGLQAYGAGIASAGAGAYVLSRPVKDTLTYDRRLAMMANTAFADQGVADTTGRPANDTQDV